jgi:hypothetical protein
MSNTEEIGSQKRLFFKFESDLDHFDTKLILLFFALGEHCEYLLDVQFMST